MKRPWSWGELIAGVLFLVSFAILLGLAATVVRAADLDGVSVILLGRGRIVVVDGDTVKLDGDHLVQLTGYDTPDILHPKCAKEKALGLKAKARLEEMVAKNKPVVLEVKSKSCAFGRTCGVLSVSTPAGSPVDVGELLIDEKLAEPMVCKDKCPPLRDWCK